MPGYLFAKPDVATRMFRDQSVSLHACCILNSWSEGFLRFWDRDFALDFTDEHLIEAGNALSTKERGRLVGAYFEFEHEVLHLYNMAQRESADLWYELHHTREILQRCTNRNNIFNEYMLLRWKLHEEGFSENEMLRGWDDVIADRLHATWIYLRDTLRPGDLVETTVGGITIEGAVKTIIRSSKVLYDDMISIEVRREFRIGIPGDIAGSRRTVAVERSDITKILAVRPEPEEEQA